MDWELRLLLHAGLFSVNLRVGPLLKFVASLSNKQILLWQIILHYIVYTERQLITQPIEN